MVNWKKKKFLQRCISKIFLFIDTERHSKMWIFSWVFFKDFIDRFGTTYLKNWFLWMYFSKTFLKYFRIATYLKSGLSRMYSWRIENFYNKNNSLKGTPRKKIWKASVLIFLVYYHLQDENSHKNMLVYFLFFLTKSMYAYIHTGRQAGRQAGGEPKDRVIIWKGEGGIDALSKPYVVSLFKVTCGNMSIKTILALNFTQTFLWNVPHL